MFTKVNKQSPFKVTKEEITKSAAWNDVANDRFKKQHPHDTIPEGDHHAVPTLSFGPDIQAPPPEEMQQAVDDLEKQINELKSEEKNKPVQQTPPTQKPKDDFYDDWRNE